MIPSDYITEWRQKAPWVQDFQVEQDLVISRALVEVFTHPTLADSLAFRGGTALYKLHIDPPARYSEDIDLVQVRAEPAGPMMEALREVLDPWLGAPRWKQSGGRVTFAYRFTSEGAPPLPLRLKVEINSREHFAVYGLRRLPFGVQSGWYEGSTEITTYTLDELLGTKLRALYQRSKGRDLFDLHMALRECEVDTARVAEAFLRYMAHGNHEVSRDVFEQNIAAKLQDPNFNADIGPLLSTGYSWDCKVAVENVFSRLIARLP